MSGIRIFCYDFFMDATFQYRIIRLLFLLRLLEQRGNDIFSADNTMHGTRIVDDVIYI